MILTCTHVTWRVLPARPRIVQADNRLVPFLNQAQEDVVRSSQAVCLEAAASRPLQADVSHSSSQQGEDPWWIFQDKGEAKVFQSWQWIEVRSKYQINWIGWDSCNTTTNCRVHERGGMTDKVLYNLTVFILLIGAVEYFRVVYQLAFPSSDWKKWPFFMFLFTEWRVTVTSHGETLICIIYW